MRETYCAETESFALEFVRRGDLRHVKQFIRRVAYVHKRRGRIENESKRGNRVRIKRENRGRVEGRLAAEGVAGRSWKERPATTRKSLLSILKRMLMSVWPTG